MKELETPQVLIDEFKVKGEKLIDGGFREAEIIFQQCDDNVDEVSYDSCHVILYASYTL